jgi:hypothetical protein
MARTVVGLFTWRLGMSLLAGVRINPKNGSLKCDRTMDNYFREFRELQHTPVKLLELGVFGGGSLKIWDGFFPNGSAFGIDREFKFDLAGRNRERCFLGDQQNTTFLDRIARKVAPEGFDIIIDDCSHIGELTKISFWHLFQHHLKPGGIYVIEDWLTGYIPEWEDGVALRYDPKDIAPENGEFHGHQHGMAGFVKELIDEFARNIFFDPVPDGSRESRIAQMKFFKNQVFIYKP